MILNVLDCEAQFKSAVFLNKYARAKRIVYTHIVVCVLNYSVRATWGLVCYVSSARARRILWKSDSAMLSIKFASSS